MSLLSSGRLYKQYCVYWESKKAGGATGQPNYEEPRVVKCRWEDRMQEFLSSSGQTLISRSIVFVPEVLSEDGYLWLSPLKKNRTTTETQMAVLVLADLTERVINQEDETDIYSPHRIIDAWQIRHRDSIPDLKNRNVLRIVIL